MSGGWVGARQAAVRAARGVDRGDGVGEQRCRSEQDENERRPECVPQPLSVRRCDAGGIAVGMGSEEYNSLVRTKASRKEDMTLSWVWYWRTACSLPASSRGSRSNAVSPRPRPLGGSPSGRCKRSPRGLGQRAPPCTIQKRAAVSSWRPLSTCSVGIRRPE